MKLVKLCAVIALVVMMLVPSAFAADKKLTFVMVPKGVHPYYEPCFEGFKAAGEKLGINVEYQAPQDFDIALQVKVLEDLIARGVDGIAISALDDTPLVPVIQQAMDAGIKIITFDAPAPSSAQLCYIGTNNKNAGYAGGKMIVELMGKKGNLALMQGGLAAPNLNLRTEGVREAIAAEAPEVKIVTLEDTQGNLAEAVNKTEAILQTYADLNAIFGVSAEVAQGASPVIKEQGKAGQVLLAGFDDLKDTLQGIRDGVVQFCIVQKTFTMGWLSVEKLKDAVEGKEIPKEIDTGVIIVTKDNIDTYMDDMKKEIPQ